MQHHKNHPSVHIKPRHNPRMYHVFAPASVTIYAAERHAHALYSARSAHKCSGILESRPLL